MSFSNDVKAELSEQLNSKSHCRLSETAAIISMCGTICISQFEKYSIKIVSENIYLAKKIYLLLKKVYGVVPETAVRNTGRGDNSRRYAVVVKDDGICRNIVKDVETVNAGMDGSGSAPDRVVGTHFGRCCKRAFLRGSFIAAGYIGEPSKAYHLEIVCNSTEKSGQLVQLLQAFEIEAKTVARKGYFVVYIKEGQGIVNVLNVIGAHVSLMNFENIRIVREMRNGLNRRVNCEAANMYRTVSSSIRQAEAIEYIMSTIGIEKLPESLQEMAYVRLENPEAPLAELGQMMSRPLGKSGVNHRLRRICEIADDLRTQNKEVNHDN